MQRLVVLQHLHRYQEYLALGDEVCATLSFQDYYTIKFGSQPKDLDEDLLKGIVEEGESGDDVGAALSVEAEILFSRGRI